MRNGRLRTYLFSLGLVVLWLALGGLAPAQAAPGTYHQDDRMGFKIRHPKGWSHVGMRAEEKWIVAKFISDRTHTYLDEVDKSTWSHRPDMTVIAFIDEVVKKSGIEKTETDDGEFFLEINNPFKNYKDYLKRTFYGGGWFVSEEEEGEIKGIPVTKLEIKVEKLTSSGPKRIVTWIFHADDVDLAVQFQVLENSYKKLRGDIYGCLKSFRFVPRTKGSLTPVTTGGPKKRVDEDALTPAERTKHRQETERQIHEKTIKSLPDDWKVKEMGRFLVLLHGDEKFAKKVVAQAEATWKWLDKNFGFVGTGEYVRRPIVRICKNEAEERALLGGTSWGNSLEIVTHKDTGSGAMSWEFEYVNQRMLNIWFNHHARDTYSAMPHWLDNGLWQVIGTARLKGSRFVFKVDSWEREGLRESVRKGDLTPPRDLVMLGRSEFRENPHRTKQSAAFIRFLLESKSKKTRVILKDYLMNLQDVVTEATQAAKDAEPTEYEAAETEEEEEERFRKRREAWKEKEREFLTTVFERTFGDWSDKDWRKLQTQYFKSMD